MAAERGEQPYREERKPSELLGKLFRLVKLASEPPRKAVSTVQMASGPGKRPYKEDKMPSELLGKRF